MFSTKQFVGAGEGGGHKPLLTLTQLSSAREKKTSRNSQCGPREAMGSFLLLFADNKITQWEDPRLQNPAITGPVSTAVGSFMKWGPAGPAADWSGFGGAYGEVLLFTHFLGPC